MKVRQKAELAPRYLSSLADKPQDEERPQENSVGSDNCDFVQSNALRSSLDRLLDEEGCTEAVSESTRRKILDWHANHHHQNPQKLVSEFTPEYIYEYDANPAVDRDTPDFKNIKKRVIEKCDKVPSECR